MTIQRSYFIIQVTILISNDVGETYKTVKQSKASITEESHLVAVEENKECTLEHDIRCSNSNSL
jgi:hypothetical protein